MGSSRASPLPLDALVGRRARDGWLSDDHVATFDALGAADIADDAQLEEAALRDVDLGGIEVSHVVLCECALQRVDLRNAPLARLVAASVLVDDCDLANDLTTSTLAGVRGVGGLRGAHLRAEQLVTLVPALAAHVGIVVDHDD